MVDGPDVHVSGHPAIRRVAHAGLWISLAPILAAAFGHPIGHGWAATLIAFGPPIAFALLYIWARYDGTTPGIKNDGVFFHQLSGRKLGGIALGLVLTGLYVLLYWFPSAFGFVDYGEPAGGVIALLEPLSQALRGTHADHWFLYGFLYTVAVLVMGARMFYRYRHNRYQLARTASVMFFQLAFAFLLPALLLAFNQPEFYFTYFWPLKPEYLWPDKMADLASKPGGIGLFMIGWGIIASFVFTPLLTWRFGKRWYCSWVCGCGGLAETAGDPFRQLSSKKMAAWKFERWSIHLTLVTVVVVTALLWINNTTQGAVFGEASRTANRVYGFVVASLLSGVVGVGFYPLLGSRVWCRFFCPMAAILGIGQRFASRFRITTNGGQCMSCGNCSTYCEMGIDVRAYAMRGENIVRASCVGCGICAAVCPRGVLKLENGPTHKDRFPGAEHPLSDLLGALRKP
ncbi:MAG: 4Fe-4S binding protein [Myxococcales bacterium]|nr:4Fe-4S binding protein [Myxococcales bacterium]